MPESKIQAEVLSRLPGDLRTLRLKYEGTCLVCGKRLSVGTTAMWSKSSKSVCCATCFVQEIQNASVGSRTHGESHADTLPSSNSETSEKDGSIDLWQKICRYAQKCVEAEAARSLVQYGLQGKMWFIHPNSEKLIIGDEDTIPAIEPLWRNPEVRAKSIVYGWPTVVLIDSDRKAKIAPLFFVELELEKEEQWVLHATTEPEFNEAITTSSIFDPVLKDEVNNLLSHGIPFGDAHALVTLATQIADLLGLQVLSTLDVNTLEGHLSTAPGLQNVAVSLLVNETGYTQTLSNELDELAERDDWTESAARFLIASDSTLQPSKIGQSESLAAPLACNYSQEGILKQIRTSPLTVVTGPPGTGKTQFVVNAVANAWLDNQSVLVTSTNNQAVDVAVERAYQLCKGLLIRTGNRKFRESVADCVASAVTDSETVSENQAVTRARLKRVSKEREHLLDQIAQLSELDGKILQNLKKKDELLKRKQGLEKLLWFSAKVPLLPISLSAIHKRAKRLVNAWWFRRFRERRLRNLIGCRASASMAYLVEWVVLHQWVKNLSSYVELKVAKRNELEDWIGDTEERLSNLDEKWFEASLDAVRVECAMRILSGSGYLDSSFATRSSREVQVRQAICGSLEYLRGWACTALAARSNLYLKPGLFDLVIVDEASQCNLAAILPVAYRAKRLVIVGDPHQLKPIVSLNEKTLVEIAKQSELDNNELLERGIQYRQCSAYEAFVHAYNPNKPRWFNEHYRCVPEIAKWFNKTFYRDRLTVLTDVSHKTKRNRVIEWIDVEGVAERTRNASWENQEEAKKAIRWLSVCVGKGHSTLGVITPFAAQAKLINMLAESELGVDHLHDLSFTCGTAHRLQGDERETIIVSMVISPGMWENSLRWIEREKNLLNVAVSRARSSLIVLGHPLVSKFGGPTLSSLREYLRKSHENKTPHSTFRTDSHAEKLLLDAMQMRRLSPLTKLDVEGYELDFALFDNGMKLNVEVDGDQHLDERARQRRIDITRDRILSRLGWEVVRIPAWMCYTDIGEAVDKIVAVQSRKSV